MKVRMRPLNTLIHWCNINKQSIFVCVFVSYVCPILYFAMPCTQAYDMNILTYITNLTLHKNKICLYMIYGRKSSFGEHIWENFRGNLLALEGWVRNANRGKSPQGRNLIILWKGKCGYPWGAGCIPYICITMYLLYMCEKSAYRGIFRENKNCDCILGQRQEGYKYPHFLFDSWDFHPIQVCH